MERESFVFYKSFYEAVADLNKDIKLEVLTAIIEYALFGKTPQKLKPFAQGMFTLVKPNIDNNNKRYLNGTRGGRKKKASPPKPPESADAQPPYSQTYEQEVEAMRSDKEWAQTICQDFEISQDEFTSRLSRFLARCKDDAKKKGRSGHDSAEDARSHLRYWMSKTIAAGKRQSSPTIDESSSAPDYSFTGGFGGLDT